MSIGKNQLIGAMELRFDHYSARAVLEMALSRAGLEDKESYAPAEVSRISAVLPEVESGTERVQAQLEALAGSSGGAPAQPATKAKEEAKPEAAKPEPAKPEPAKPQDGKKS